MGRASFFRSDDRRPPHARAAALVRQAAAVPRLPPTVARFYLRALSVARAAGDSWSLDVSTRPRELAEVLAAARGLRPAVEVGTGAGWTTIALALADPLRTVVSYDVEAHPERDRYLALVAPSVRDRIVLLDRARATDADRPAAPAFVFVDSSHERDETIATFREWAPRVPPGGVVAFHDFGDPAYPGVEAAVRALGLRGTARARLFQWRA